MSNRNTETHRIRGLDTLRFIAALWVVFGHCGYFPLTDGIDRTSIIGRVIQGIYGNLFAAVPAVIVFFVISGFCIHYPYRAPNTFELIPYLARRYLRICIPLVAAVLLARPFNVNLTIFHNSILWTLIAELIYYSLYPAIRLLSRKFGWNKLISVSYLLAFCAILTHPEANDFSPYGIALNWLVALPCWLLGCRLAEVSFDRNRAGANPLRLWNWRFGIWFLSSLCSVLRFHSPIGYPWTVNLFAIPVFFWLQVEIESFRASRSTRLWEWAGKWSYSIYLTHLIANTAYGFLHTPNLGVNLNWVQRFFFILGFAYVFYLLVEKPAHLIARHVSMLLRKGTPSATSSPNPEAISQISEESSVLLVDRTEEVAIRGV